VEEHLSGSAVVIGVVSIFSADDTLQKGNFGAHCLLLFDGDLKPRILDEIFSSHKGQRFQSAVFLYSAWGKLTQFHQVPSKEILGFIEETVQTLIIFLQKGKLKVNLTKLEPFLCLKSNCVTSLFCRNGEIFISFSLLKFRWFFLSF
jgi:hypothetical protein